MFRATFVSLALLTLLAQGVNLETDTQLEANEQEPYFTEFAQDEQNAAADLEESYNLAEVETQQPGGTWADRLRGGGNAPGTGAGGGKKYTGPPLTNAAKPKATFINGHGMTSNQIVS